MNNQFLVTVNKAIAHPTGNIQIGDQAVISCGKSPEAGKLVLCGSEIELWTGQENIKGVVTQIIKHVDTLDNGVPRFEGWELN